MSRAWKHTRTTAQRGYGHAHQQLRERWRPRVETGQVVCWRCHQRILRGQAWHLGHDDQDRRFYRGPEHANRRCVLGAPTHQARPAKALSFFHPGTR